MKNLKAILIATLGMFLFASCSNQYGCPYNTLNETEIDNIVPTEKTIPAQRNTAVGTTVAVAR